MSKKLLFKGGHRTAMTPYEIEDFLSLYMRDVRVDEKTKAYIDSIIGNTVLNLCPYRNVLVTHKYDTVEGNVVTLDDCQDDEIIQLSEIQGNTMINCNKDTDKELILMPNLDTSGYSNITLTSGIDGGKVDISLEGNTMVNVCEQEDPIAITKSYTVETGNHIALQGEYDGKCRPNIYGNTLVNLFNKDGNNVANPNIEFNEADMSYTTTNTEWCRLPRTSVVKPNTTYTYMYKFKTTSTKCEIRMEGKEYGSGSILNNVSYTDLTQNKIYTTLKTFTTRDTEEFFNLCVRNAYDGVVTIYEPIILEGDYTNKPIPDYFTGMKSSFEDKLVPESIAYFPNTLCTTPSTSYKSITFGDTSSLKPSTMYTIVQKSHKTSNHAPTNTDKNPYCIVFGNHKGDSDLWTVRAYPSNGDIKEGLSVYTFTTPSDFSISTSNFIVICENNRGSEFELELFIVEGDYTNYDFTDYDSTKAGKYKVDYKVTGKNKFNGKSLLSTYITSNEGVIQNTVDNDARTWAYSQSQYFIPLSPGSYTISMHIINPSTDINNACRVCLPDDSTIISWGKKVFDSVSSYSANFTLNVHTVIGVELKLFKGATCKIQIEEGTTATTYEPYKESIKTLYLNSPLLEGDTIEQSGNNIIHVHRYKEVVLDGSEDEGWTIVPDNYAPSNTDYTIFYMDNNCKLLGIVHCDKIPTSTDKYITGSSPNSFAIGSHTSGKSIRICIEKSKLSTQDVAGFRQWLQNNPTTVVYQLATPVYEEVECDLSKLALEGYNHGTLFYNSNIPVTTQFYDFKVNIKDMLIPNETYYITFIADRVKDITINLSGVQVNYKTSMGYNKVPIQLGDVVNTNFSMDSRGVELSDLMISTSTSLIYVKDMNDVCIYEEASNKYSITITSTGGNESDKRVILLDYPLLRLNKDIYDRLYYNNKDSRYRIDKKVFKHKFTNDREYSKYAAETNDTYYSSFISLNETIKDYVVITNEKVKTVKVEDDKYYFKIKWSDLGVSEKTEANGNQGMKDFFNNNEVYLYYATDGFVEIVDGLTRQTLKVYQPETTMNFLGNTTTTVTIVIPKKNI